MPYISTDKRTRLVVDGIPRDVGELNYMITDLIDIWLTDNVNYSNINAAIGVLECAKLELYRRIAAPYEDTKLVENGDVYICNNISKG